MKRWSLLLGAAAVCVIASSQAQASYQVIRWSTGLCQIWSHSIPTKPFPSDFKAVSRPHKTFGGALGDLNALVKARKCGW